MSTTIISREIGNAVIRASKNYNQKWYSPHMAAASRAIAERIPLVDILLDIRDARIPISSEFQLLKNHPFSSPKRIIVMNKIDLADPWQSKEWMNYFNQQNCLSYALNSHNKDNVRQFLNFLQGQVREMQKAGHLSHTTTIMLLGIPNVGKSAIANSLHQLGRISAAEKGKLKHATVSPQPGETKDISSLKIASHPNIYVLDTPGILPPKILDAELCSKLVLTGALQDYLAGIKEVARYFLAILSSSDQYKKWEKLFPCEKEGSFIEQETELCQLDLKRRRQYPTDHTQDSIVRDVRQTLFETISNFGGNLETEADFEKFTELQFGGLRKAFRITAELEDDICDKVAFKLLNLYRTGRLGHHTLDNAPVGQTCC